MNFKDALKHDNCFSHDFPNRKQKIVKPAVYTFQPTNISTKREEAVSYKDTLSDCTHDDNGRHTDT